MEQPATGWPPARDIAAVFGLRVIGTLVPVLGWLVGVWLVVRASSWSAREKLAGLSISRSPASRALTARLVPAWSSSRKRAASPV